MPSVMHSSAPLSLKVYSLNAKGLNIPEKQCSVLTEARRQRAQVVFLQETHFKSGSTPCLSNSRIPEVYHAFCADSKMKGVSIVLTKSFTFRLMGQMLDPEGIFLFLKGIWKDRPVKLANIYCPNSKQVTFLKETLLQLTTLVSIRLTYSGGVFNMALDSLLYTSTGTSSLPFSILRQAKLALASLTLHNGWCTLYPWGRHFFLIST